MSARDLVLAGGGHCHALVLRSLIKQPLDGIRLTLINETLHTPYSGLLPGYVAGHYRFNDIHIDLQRLCQSGRVRFIHDRVIGLDTAHKKLILANQPAVPYQWLSINTGSTPNLNVVGAARFAIGVKPIARFATVWQQLLAEASTMHCHWAIVGAGAAGVEIALAMRHRLRALAQPVALSLVYSGADILPGYHRRVRNTAARALAAAEVQLVENFTVAEVTPQALIAQDGRALSINQSFWCTPATAPSWPRLAGLATDEAGFIGVNDYLQCLDHEDIFACGDIATLTNQPRPKAGVFAVRSAPFLAHNLRAMASGKALMPVHLQRHFLSLITLGEQHAVGQRAGLTFAGHWVWRWKDYLDRHFMAQFHEGLPTPPDNSKHRL